MKKGEGKLIRSKYDLAMFIYAGIEVFVFGGITYGWPNLVRALKHQGYFYDQCPPAPSFDLHGNSTNSTEEQFGGEKSCSSQDDMFGLVYNVASVVTGLGNMVIGLAVDRLPMVAIRTIYMVLFFIGAMCTAFSSPQNSALLIPGMLTIRIGGFLVYYANMRLANSAPKIKGTIITIYAGMFDSSSSLLYIIMVAYQSGVSVQSSFFFYAFTMCVPLVCTLILFPAMYIDSDGKFERFPKIIHSMFENKGSANVSSEKSQREAEAIPMSEKTSETPAPEVNEACAETPGGRGRCEAFLSRHNMTFLMDVKFYFFLFVLSVLTLRKEFFVISYDAALVKAANGDKNLVEHYSAVFGIVQFFALLVTPVGGITIDYSRSKGSLKAYVWQFAFTLFLGMLLCVCAFIKPIEIYYASNIIYVVCRALTYSIAAAYISDTYPMKMFGSILGTTETIGYLLSLLQYPLLTWSNGPLNQDYRAANGIILVLCALAMAHPINLFLHYRKLEKSAPEQKNPSIGSAPEAVPLSTENEEAPNDANVAIA